MTNWLSFILENEAFWNDATSVRHEARMRILLTKLLEFGRANNVRPLYMDICN